MSCARMIDPARSVLCSSSDCRLLVGRAKRRTTGDKLLHKPRLVSRLTTEPKQLIKQTKKATATTYETSLTFNIQIYTLKTDTINFKAKGPIQNKIYL